MNATPRFLTDEDCDTSTLNDHLAKIRNARDTSELRQAVRIAKQRFTNHASALVDIDDVEYEQLRLLDPQPREHEYTERF